MIFKSQAVVGITLPTDFISHFDYYENGVDKMEDFISQNICDGVQFNHLKDTRFKTGRTSVAFLLPLNEQTAAASSLLSNILTQTCKKYPDYTLLNRKLSMLYGAGIYSSVSKLGDNLVLKFSGISINDRYAFDKTPIFSELTDLLCSLIFEPNLTNGLFEQKDIERERRQILEDIEAEYNDKRRYASKRCIKIMCEGEPYAYPSYGSAEAVKNITSETLVQQWKTMLNTARAELTLLGETDPESVKSAYAEFFDGKGRADTPFVKIQKPAGEVKRVTEEQDIAQSKMFLGFRCNIGNGVEDYLAGLMMSAIFGGMPMSKLFLNVREKMSLCYYCASGYSQEKNILMVDSGVETENIQKAEEEILNQLCKMQNGEISEEEMNTAKLALSNSFVSHLDSLSALERFYIKQKFSGTYVSPAILSQKLKDITTEQVVRAAQSVCLDTVYTLRGKA